MYAVVRTQRAGKMSFRALTLWTRQLSGLTEPRSRLLQNKLMPSMLGGSCSHSLKGNCSISTTANESKKL